MATHAPGRAAGPPAGDPLGRLTVELGHDGFAVAAYEVCAALAERPEVCVALDLHSRPLAEIAHAALARVVGIDVPSAADGRLRIRQEWLPGERLHDWLSRRAREARPPLAAHATFVLHESIAALKALHAGRPGACHGALSPARVLLSSDGRLVLHETVLGPALGALPCSPEWVARELGLRVPEVPGIPPFTPLTDQYQLGRVVLAMLIAEPVADDTEGVRAQLASATARFSDGTAMPVDPDLESILQRMLLLSLEGPFRSMVALERAVDALIAAHPEYAPVAPSVVCEPVPSLEPVAVTPVVAMACGPVAAPEPFDGRQDLAFDADAGEFTLPPELGQDVAGVVGPPREWQFSPEAGDPTAMPLHAERDRLVVEPQTAVTTAPPPWSPPPPVETEHQPLARRLGSPDRQPTPEEPAAAPKRAVKRREPGADLQEAVNALLGEEPTREGDERLTAHRPIPVAPRPRRSNGRLVLTIVGLLALVGVASALAWQWRATAPLPPGGYLRLESKPTGAAVRINGEHRGETPLFLPLPSGTYSLEFTLGEERRSLSVPVTPDGEAYQLVSLYPPGPPGVLVVGSVPPGAAVFVDGEPRGQTPAVLEGIIPGEHVVAVESGVSRLERSVEVGAGARVELMLPLSGTVVADVPFPVTISEGDTVLGRSPGAGATVAAGKRWLRFSNAELNYEETRVVEVRAGSTTRVPLVPPTGVISFTADVPAEVLLDGRLLGTTPLANVPVALGSHEVLFRDAATAEVRYLIVVAVGPAYRLHATMQSRAIQRSGGAPRRR